MNLTNKQAQFVAAYKLSGDATQSAITAGYAVKSASVEGCRLLKNNKIIAELESWRLKRAKDITKEDLINNAMDDYRSIEVKEPNRPRFLELTGKLLGFIGGQTEEKRPNQTMNIQINMTGREDQAELWQMTRKLLGDSA